MTRKLKCLIGIHTGLIDSTYKFKSYKEGKEEEKGFGSIDATFGRTCTHCGKNCLTKFFLLIGIRLKVLFQMQNLSIPKNMLF